MRGSDRLCGLVDGGVSRCHLSGRAGRSCAGRSVPRMLSCGRSPLPGRDRLIPCSLPAGTVPPPLCILIPASGRGVVPRARTASRLSLRTAVQSRHSPPLLPSLRTKTVPRASGRSHEASRESERVYAMRLVRSPGRRGTHRTRLPSRTNRTLAGTKNAFLWKWEKWLWPKPKLTETKEWNGYHTHEKTGSKYQYP